jgi:hypothetical protein
MIGREPFRVSLKPLKTPNPAGQIAKILRHGTGPSYWRATMPPSCVALVQIRKPRGVRASPFSALYSFFI